MNSKYLKHHLAILTYTDNTDVVALRYLLLNILVEVADEYRRNTGSAYALQLLQQHKKLENIHLFIKEKLRANNAAKDDFIVAQRNAVACVENFVAAPEFVIAA